MKDLSVNNILISGQSPVVQGDIGGEPNQIPLNKDLGSLAYMNAPQIEDINVDTLELQKIATEIRDTAVDVFVYDTRKDSDGGAWRKRTQHTSWYNEELNTETRGGRREFPAVAVIVAEGQKVTIYDGDDPDLSMWMVFKEDAALEWASASSLCTSLSFLNGLLAVGSDRSGVILFDLLKDDIKLIYFENQYFLTSGRLIVDRNNSTSAGTGGDGIDIVNSEVNDVAMTILPNAPVDYDTGLPTPTIAVATEGGVGIIKDDGSVVNLNVSNRAYSSVYLDGDLVWAVENPNVGYDLLRYFKIPSSDITAADGDYGPNSTPALSPIKAEGYFFDSFAYGSPVGLTKLDHDSSDASRSLVAYISSTYNTGWMPGDIKLATLSDTTVETVGQPENELVSNGTFDSNANDWSAVNGSTLSSVGGALKIQGSGTSYPAASTQVSVVEGTEYEVFAEYLTGSFHGRIRVSTNNPMGGDIVNGDIEPAGNNHLIRFTAPSTGSVYITLILQDVNGNSTGTWDNVSVKRVANLVENGAFNNETTGWTGLSGATLSIDNGRLKIEETTNAVDAYAVNSSVIPTLVGKRYVITWQFIKGTNTGFAVRFGNSGNQTYDYKSNTNNEYTDDGYYSFEFTATGTRLNLSFIVNEANSHGFVDNVSVRLAEEDRSANNKGLQVFGEITKSPVATGADLVAYSGFSANNYLMQPYNSDLNFGTGDFCVMLWLKFNKNDAYDGIISKANSWLIDTGLNNSIHFKFWNGSAYQSSVSADGDSVYGAWRCLCVKRESDVLSLFLDGVEKTDPNNPHSNSTDFTSEFGLLVGSGPGSPANDTLISLVRVSKTAPTAEQIAKIYSDEKVLFQDGSQATLHGTSDSVRALAYDDKTQVLHVGTASGRSDFSGLRRIKNTTTAVTTSISASNNLIAEQ